MAQIWLQRTYQLRCCCVCRGLQEGVFSHYRRKSFMRRRSCFSFSCLRDFKSENRVWSYKKLYITLILDDISREGIQERPEADDAVVDPWNQPGEAHSQTALEGTQDFFFISYLQLKAHCTPLTASVSAALFSLHVFWAKIVCFVSL